MAIIKTTFGDLKNRKLTEEEKLRHEMLRNMKDEDIDYSEIPELTDEELKEFRLARELHPEEQNINDDTEIIFHIND